MTPLAAALFAFVLAVAIVTAFARDVLVAVVVFAAYSLGLALLWIVYRAPDVGLTEAAVGAGVTTSLLVVALMKTTRPTGEYAIDRRVDGRTLIGVIAFVATLLLTVPALPPVGDPSAPAFGGAAAFYLESTASLGITNVVTAILVVFRGFDTFGEVAVVFAAGLAALVVFRKEVP